MTRAQTLLGLLKRYPQYKLHELLDEDCELLQLEAIVELGGTE